MNKCVIAAVTGDIECLRGLIDTGADINTKNEDGFSLLMLAACWGRTEIVRLLVNYGADITMQSETGHTALMLAVKNDHEDTALLLTECSLK